MFAGGGSHGCVQVGMLRAIVEHGLRFDLVVGASAGAINAAYFSRSPTKEGVARMESLWRSIRRRDIMPLRFSNLWTAFTRTDSIFTGQALRALLVRCFGTFDFEEAKLPLYIVASNVLTGHEVVLSRGSVVDALMASTAIPGIFPCVSIENEDLVDGGVANNTPISTAVRLGARTIVVLPTGYACALRNRPRGAISHAMNALNHLVARQLVCDIERFCETVKIVVAPSLCPLEISSYDYSRSSYLIERAAEQTRMWITEGGYLRPERSEVMHAHLH